MADQFQRQRTIANDGTVTDTTTQPVNNQAVNNNQADTVAPSYTLARIIWFIAGVICAFLALRFIFVLLGANQSNGFVHFIYSVSYPFARPFFGMFSYTTHYGVSRFEGSTLVAIAIYLLVAWGLTRLVTIRRAKPIA